MTMIRIPDTGKVIFVANHIGDVDIDYGNYSDIDNTIKQEDVLIMGNWEDFSGSGTKSAQGVMMQGVQNELQFDLNARVDGARNQDRTARGNIAPLYRQRNRHEIVEVNDGCKN